MVNDIIRNLDWYSKQTINTTFQSVAKVLKNTDYSEKIPSINEVAKLAFTTPSSITRFCNHLGYDGFKQFINRLSIEMEFKGESNQEKVDNHNWTSDFLFENNFEQIVRNIRKINDTIYLNILQLSQNIIIHKRIYLYCHSTQKSLGDHFYSNLLKMGFNVFLINIDSKNENYLSEKHSNDDLIIFMFMENYFIENLDIKDSQKNNYFISNYNVFKNDSLNQIVFNINDKSDLDISDFNTYSFYIINQILRLTKNKAK